MESRYYSHIPQGTEGALFNRPQPLGPKGFEDPRTRDGKKLPSRSEDPKDLLTLSSSSEFKRRIPNTSVVNKMFDVKLFYPCTQITAAQIIWWLNFLCFFVHGFMAGFVLYKAWNGRDNQDHMQVKIYRLRSNVRLVFQTKRDAFDVLLLP